MNCRPQEIYTKIFRKNTNYFYGLHIAKKYMSILFTDFRPKKNKSSQIQLRTGGGCARVAMVGTTVAAEGGLG